MQPRWRGHALGSEPTGDIVRNSGECHAVCVILVGTGKKVVLQPCSASAKSDDFICLAIIDAGGIFIGGLCAGRHDV